MRHCGRMTDRDRSNHNDEPSNTLHDVKRSYRSGGKGAEDGKPKDAKNAEVAEDGKRKSAKNAEDAKMIMRNGPSALGDNI